MRAIFLTAALLLAPAAALSPSPPLRTPVEVAVMGFSAKVDDGRVVATWKRYTRDDFSYYLLVKSAAEPKPVYPKAPLIFSSNARGETRFEDGLLSTGTWHYRLCILTRFGDLWVSPAASVYLDHAAVMRAAPTAADFED
jgi:hypothetical protein